MDILSDKDLLPNITEMVDTGLKAAIRDHKIIGSKEYFNLAIVAPKLLGSSDLDLARFPHFVAARAAFLGFGNKFAYPTERKLPRPLLEPFVISNFIFVHITIFGLHNIQYMEESAAITLRMNGDTELRLLGEFMTLIRESVEKAANDGKAKHSTAEAETRKPELRSPQAREKERSVRSPKPNCNSIPIADRQTCNVCRGAGFIKKFWRRVECTSCRGVGLVDA